MKKKLATSRQAKDAILLLAAMIRAARMQRGMTAAELATRTGVSRGVIQRLEAGEGGTSISTAFEACLVLGIPLFDAPGERLGAMLEQRQEVAALLPKRAFQASQSKPDNDF